ncbi:MAG: agmatine deiminase family protein [Bacteroidetes bacterium]|nr:agmatine deiminase family protein [Bacteroidota bacterium]
MAHVRTLSLCCLWLIASGFLLGCTTPEPEARATWKAVPEYQTQEAVWVIWPTYDHVQGLSNEAVTTALVERLRSYTHVVVSFPDSTTFFRVSQQAPAAAWFQPDLGVDAQATTPSTFQVSARVIPSVEIWVRDMGPNFVRSSDGLAVVDFNFNAWGYTDVTDPLTRIEEAYDVAVAEQLGLPVIETDLISEGGNREVNDQGVMMATWTVDAGRNPEMSRTEIEDVYRDVLGITSFIWFEQGLVEDDHTFEGPESSSVGPVYTTVTTNGHVDEFARFANDSTIVMAVVPEEDLADPLGRENDARLRQNRALLAEARNADGKPFTVVDLPLPRPIYYEMGPGDATYDYIATLDYGDHAFPVGDRVMTVAAASYLNFLITDGAVFYPVYGGINADRDRMARDVLAAVFPDHRLEPLDALATNLGGGGIHCITMQQPRPLSHP